MIGVSANKHCLHPLKFGAALLCATIFSGLVRAANDRVQEFQTAISLVQLKYGNPQSTSGSISLGNVKATQQRGPIQIIVERGWPNTTTRIYLRHTANYAVKQSGTDH